MTLRSWGVLAVVMAWSASAADFQPHPSHAPPPPPSTLPPPPPAPKSKPPKAIKVVNPDYPREAERFNAQMTVGLKISVNADGSVSNIEVLNDDGVFGEAAKRAAKKWKFEKRTEPSTVRLAVPFRLDGNDDYPYDTAVRHITYKPAAAADVKGELIYGFEYVRLMLDPSGKVVGKFVEGVSPAEFSASANAIIATLKFEPADPDSIEGGRTVNSFLVDYANDGVIRIQQRSGEPAY